MEQNSKKIKYKDAEITVNITKIINDAAFGELCYTGSKTFPMKYIKMSDLVERIANINSKGIIVRFKDIYNATASTDDIYISPMDITSITIKYLNNDRSN